MGKAILIARILLGLPLIVFGLNQVFLWFEGPSDFAPEAMAWLEATDSVGYLNPLKIAVEVFCGVCLVVGCWVPFSLVLFAPVLVHIVAFHVFLDAPLKGMMAYLMLALEIFLAWAYWSHFKGVLKFNARPRGS